MKTVDLNACFLTFSKKYDDITNQSNRETYFNHKEKKVLQSLQTLNCTKLSIN